jgi:formamidopyrimidine-DNA glycosylase
MGTIMLAHLGMTGRFTVWQADGEAQNLGEFYFAEEAGRQGDGPHDHMVIDLEDGTRIVYADPRRFGFVDLIAPGAMEGNRFLAGLGVEPLGNGFNAGLSCRRPCRTKDTAQGSTAGSAHHCRPGQHICV